MTANQHLLGSATGVAPARVRRKPGDVALAGWVIGLIIMAGAIAAIAFVVPGLIPSIQQPVTDVLVAVAWWLGPISLGMLGYLLTASQRRPLRLIGSLALWALFISPIYIAYLQQDILDVIPGIMGAVLSVLVVAAIVAVEFMLFNWAASQHDSRRFITRILLVAGLNGLALWAYLDSEVLNVILIALGFALQIVFVLVFAVIQFVAIFWFMSQTKVEVIRPGDPKSLTFDDYKGQPNLLRLVKQWISLLSDRSQFQDMGGQFINGILLYGEPGTGKTLLAKCMAGEANVAFMSIEGSGFRGMFWGVDVLRMIWFTRRARKLAREYGACIAYIDEIDAVGASRGGVMGGGRMGMGGGLPMMGGGGGALTRLLYEMDGIGEQTRWEKLRAKWYQWRGKPIPTRNWHLLFMGATNRPDVLDPALTRPGRFDRIIRVDKPDRAGRREIVKYYLAKIKHDETVDLEAIVSDTAAATPAQIMSAITKDAVRLALFDGRHKVSQRDIDLAFQEQRLGLENPIEEIEDDQRRQIAYHEAGHAVAQYYLMPEERIVRVTIVRRGDALGYVMPVNNFEVYAQPLHRYVRDIMVSMAGHVATKIFLGEYWTGATGDFQTVRTRISALAHYGFFGPPTADMNAILSGQFKSKEIERFWQQCEEGVERLLRTHTAEINAVAQALLERGDMSGQECVVIIREAAAAKNGHQAVEGQLIEQLPEEIVIPLPSRDITQVAAEPVHRSEVSRDDPLVPGVERSEVSLPSD
ncbi:MAG TPA: AAA family ATPase [Anaerolineae bacterium]|nr:AAA family ATPase [Anaerolineae bacterium]